MTFFDIDIFHVANHPRLHLSSVFDFASLDFLSFFEFFQWNGFQFWNLEFGFLHFLLLNFCVLQFKCWKAFLLDFMLDYLGMFQVGITTEIFVSSALLIFIEFAELGSYANVAQFNLFTKLTIHSMHSFVFMLFHSESFGLFFHVSLFQFRIFSLIFTMTGVIQMRITFNIAFQDFPVVISFHQSEGSLRDTDAKFVLCNNLDFALIPRFCLWDFQLMHHSIICDTIAGRVDHHLSIDEPMYFGSGERLDFANPM